MSNLTYNALEEKHGAVKGDAIWQEVCRLGGYGSVPKNSESGISLTGLSPELRKKVDALTGFKEEKLKGGEN